MLELLGTVLTGGATGIIGSVIGKAFSFLDYWVEEKKKDNDHERTLKLLELQNKIGAEENEREMAVADAKYASDQRMAAYDHDAQVGVSSMWVVDVLRLVRPLLTFTLIILVGIIYFNSTGKRLEIEAGCLYMMSSAVLWWFGDRAMRKKN